MEGESWTSLPTVTYPTSSSDLSRSSPRGARHVHKGEGGEPQRPAPPRLLPGSPALGWRTPTILEAGARFWAPGRLCFFLLLPTASISWNLREGSAGSWCLRHRAFPVGLSFILAAPYLQHTTPRHPPGSWSPPRGDGLPGAGPPSATQGWEGPCQLCDSALANSGFQKVPERLQGSGITRASGASRGSSQSQRQTPSLQESQRRAGGLGWWVSLRRDTQALGRGSRTTPHRGHRGPGSRPGRREAGNTGCRRGDNQGHWPSRRLQSGKSVSGSLESLRVPQQHGITPARSRPTLNATNTDPVHFLL